jgi:exodeoxyribonuclease VII large subunit
MRLQRQYQETNENYQASEETIYSVAEYISLLNVKLKPLKATVQGEIGKISYYPRAVYFSLFDKDRTVLNCVAWPGRLQSLGIELKEGLEVKIQGYPDVYPQTGRLSFKADVITPIGEGALKLAFERLKRDLEAQGYFRQERKQQLPQHIERIGLITSETGVVIRDFLTGLGHHGLKVYFYDVRVEGLQAIENIVSAVQWFNEHTQDIQVLVLARGGGSLERLQPFNSLEVAKAIYSSKIPVMTAIGHELDVTIADLVADVRASVPMDAGQRLADSWVKAVERIDTIEGNIISEFKNACRALDANLTIYRDNFISCYAKSLFHRRQQLDSSQNTLMGCFRDFLRRLQSIELGFIHNYERFSNRLTNNSRAIDALEDTMLREAGHFFMRLETFLVSLEDQFLNSSTRFRRYLRSINEDIATYDAQIEREAKRWYLAVKKRISDCEKMLLACDPSLKLKQGFSIVKDKSGKVLRSIRTVAIHDIIQVELYDGILDTKVKDIR